MGGGSTKSDSQQNTTTETLNSSVQDNAGIALSSVKANDIDLNIVDGGAIEKMFKVTQTALNQGENASRRAMDYSFKTSNSTGAGDTKNMYVMGGVLLAAVLVVYLGNK